MKVIVAPDSFKGTLTATEVCEIIAQVCRGFFPEAAVISLPLADGGEGMAQAWQAACGGTMRRASVAGPWGEPTRAQWLQLPDGTAVIETAACAGLELARRQALNPALTTTYGVGELLRAAQAAGARRILLGLGGSATNDGGCGMAAALGWRFLDKTGAAFVPVGQTLRDICAVQPPSSANYPHVAAACDVANPLFGSGGAAHVFAPQKGADSAMVQRLDDGLRRLAACLDAEALAQTPGAGAAGGLGFGVLAFLGGALRPGIDLLLEQAGFSSMLRGADLVFTGEGSMDAQTLLGKVPMGILRAAQAAGVPVIGVCGRADLPALRGAGFAAIFPASSGERSLEELRRTCRADLAAAARRAAESARALFSAPDSL
jgi:glycerate kinase